MLVTAETPHSLKGVAYDMDSCHVL